MLEVSGIVAVIGIREATTVRAHGLHGRQDKPRIVTDSGDLRLTLSIF